MQTILTCLDFSDTTEAVLSNAIKLAKATGARLALLHIQQPELDYGIIDMGYVSQQLGNPIQASLLASTQQLDVLAERVRDAGVQAQTICEDGLVVERVMEQAKQLNADLIVVMDGGRVAGILTADDVLTAVAASE